MEGRRWWITARAPLAAANEFVSLAKIPPDGEEQAHGSVGGFLGCRTRGAGYHNAAGEGRGHVDGIIAGTKDGGDFEGRKIARKAESCFHG